MARLTVFAVLLWPLLGGCGPAVSTGVVRAEAAPPEMVVRHAATDRARVDMSDAQFRAAMAWLAADVHLASAPFAGRVALADVVREPNPGDELQRDYTAWCKRRYGPSDCLSLLSDGAGFTTDAKRTLALSFALDSAWSGVEDVVRESLDPLKLQVLLLTSLTGYLALLVVPEPISKALAASFAVLLWGYLGSELWTVVSGYLELMDEVDEATTFEQIRDAGEHFGKLLGEKTTRVLLLVATAAIGSTVGLAARASKLPGYVQATRLSGLDRRGMSLAAMAGRTRTVTVAAPSVAVVLTSGQAVMMAAAGSGSGDKGSAARASGGFRAYRSHKSFKRAMGSAGPGKEWHHLVEQTPGNVKRFGSKALHNTENELALEKDLHGQVSAFYSSNRPFITGSNEFTVRKWLEARSYEEQREFGLMVIEKLRRGLWR